VIPPPNPERYPAQEAEHPTQALIEAHVAEYLALRSEIEWLIKDGSQYQGFAIALLAAALPVLQFLEPRYHDAFLASLLVIPFLFCLLGFLYFRQHEEVYVIAAYLARSLRPRVRALTGDESLWAWEEFKAAQATHAGRSGLRWVTGGGPVLVLRALLFLLPSVLAVLTTIGLLIVGPPYLPPGAARFLFVAAIVFDAAITALMALFLLARSNLAKVLSIDGVREGTMANRMLSPLLWFAERARRPARGALAAVVDRLARLRGTPPSGSG
jgi:hypothetical protein